MKKNILMLVLMLWSAGAWAQEIATRTLTTFSQVEVDGDFTVILRAGNKEEARIESRGIPLDDIKIYVKGNRLYIKRKTSLKRLSDDSKTSITVTFTKLTDVVNSGSSDVLIESKLEGKSYFIENKGSGKVEASFLCEKLSIKQVGSGEIVLHGGTDKLEIELRGSGNVEAYDLQAASADISILGSGDAKVTVTDNIDAKITGSGDIYYKGRPERVQVQSLGSGTAKAVKE
ncbi:MAG: hypothetical protein KatS3mg033_0310 [Thermonema sp.]|uniref:head GIN domain-containing protein n=1 Tax=Thermonema sp. TaxID=2231181 RepID=UPI0021DC0985|nr:head GIN domain-containing protein [Thermonema sp.]GIV38510.1 MAG: hypothetical protein KatS3mg033_0310 [Thermonema sp.]